MKISLFLVKSGKESVVLHGRVYNNLSAMLVVVSIMVGMSESICLAERPLEQTLIRREGPDSQ